jgi:hypothetical protein
MICCSVYFCSGGTVSAQHTNTTHSKHAHIMSYGSRSNNPIQEPSEAIATAAAPRAMKARSMTCENCNNYFGLIIITIMTIMTMMAPFRSVDAQHHQGEGVMDLTPAVVDTLKYQKVPMYVVKLDACHSGNVACSQLDDYFWKPFANMVSSHPSNPLIPFFRLNCNTQRDLCDELSTSNWVDKVYQNKGVDFLTVVYSESRPSKRLVEYYMEDPDPETYMKYFLDMISRRDPFEPTLPDMINVHASKKEKVDIAIMVLTVDGFIRPDVWDAFLKTQTEGAKVRIFMHNKIPSDELERGNLSSNTQVDGVIQVPIVYTSKLSPGIIRATIQMLRHAIAYGGAKHFLLVSGDTVPLYAAPDVVKELAKTKNSRFEPHVQSFVNGNMLRRNYVHTAFDDRNNGLLKSKQWITLNEEAAAFFANPKNDHTGNYEIMVNCDEYYWPNIATEFGIPFDTLPFMYDEWPKEQAKQPLWLTKVDPTIDRGMHLFARKITKDTDLRLQWMCENNGKVTDSQ